MFFDIAGSEAQEIVDDHVNGSADGVAGKIRIVHGLGEDALSGESGVTVYEEWKIFFASAFSSAVLLGAGAADSDRIDGFEMAGVRNQMNVNLIAAVSNVLAGSAPGIFHVTGAENTATFHVFKSSEKSLQRALGAVGNHAK